MINYYQNLKLKSNIDYDINSPEIIEAKLWSNTVRSIRLPTNDLNTIKKTLSDGKPILISMRFNLGQELADQFKQIQIIKPSDIKENGNHMMVIVGYDDLKQAFKVRNSWGVGWGFGGYCYLSYEFFSKNSDIVRDLQIINLNLDTYKSNLDKAKSDQTKTNQDNTRI